MKGIYFKSEKDLTSHFLLTYDVKIKNHNCLVKIYDINLPQQDLENGDEVEDFDPSILVEINFWNKYYFPEFGNFDNHWYYNINGKEDRIGAVNDVIKYGMKIALSKGNIDLY